MNRRETGGRYEALAAAFLENKGFRILERNFRWRRGEIDLIAAEKEILVFVEVKFRSSSARGLPEEAVTEQKQQRIFRTAEVYLCRHPEWRQKECRFDVIAVDGGRIRHIRRAFGGF